MSTQFSTFLLAVQRRIGDSSDATEILLSDVINAKVREFEDKVGWYDLRDRFEFTTVANQREYTLTGINTTYNTENIISLKERQTRQALKRMALKRYEETVSDYTTETGSASHFIPFTDTEFFLYPTPNRADVMTGYIQKKHAYLSTGSQYFEFTDDKVDIIKYGVLSDWYLGKGDDRFGTYNALWRKGIKSKKSNIKRHLNASNNRLLPGNSVE